MNNRTMVPHIMGMDYIEETFILIMFDVFRCHSR